MKNEDKKVPDAPDILFVCPFHTGLTSGLIDEEGNHQGGNPVWHGMAVRVSADDEEYINLSHAWHKQSDNSINHFHYAYIIYYTSHHPPDGFHHSASCLAGCVSIIAIIHPFRIYVRSCQLYTLGYQRLVHIDVSSSVPLPSPTGCMALLRGDFVRILSGITCIGCIRIDFFLHGILSAMVLSVSPNLLLANDARYGYRFPPPLHSWYLPHSSILFRFHLFQGREIYPACQHT